MIGQTNRPLLLYSTGTWLAYAIAERFYGGLHYSMVYPVLCPGNDASSELLKMLFDFPATANLLDVAKVSHHVIQLIRHWSYSTSADDELAVRGDPTLTDHQIELIRRVVDSITAVEDKPLHAIPRDRIDRYVVRLSGLLQDATRREMSTSDERGRKLLGELRASYSGIREHAA